MRQRLRTATCLVLTLLAGGWTGLGQDRLSDAYAAVLRGDYDRSRTLLAKTAGDSGPGGSQRLLDWLDHFASVSEQREQNRAETFDWNIEQARAAAAAGDTYLALSFLSQSLSYAEDEADLTGSDWVQSLRSAALDAARELCNREKWRKAHSYYVLLQRLYEDDSEIEALREAAARHARLEALYEDGEAVERRIENVKGQLLANAVEAINRQYYKVPDYRAMAVAGIEAIEALATTRRLYEGPKASRLFDGVAVPRSQEFFLARLGELKRDVEGEGDFDAKELLRAFRRVTRASRDSVMLPEELLVVEFTEGAFGELDAYTSVVWPADASEFDKLMVGEFCGVGIQLGTDELTGRLMVATPLENSPALRAGIQPDDLIIAVDGVTTADWDSDKAVREITGIEGTEVVLTIFRPSSGAQIDFPLTRSKIQLTTVRGVNRLDEQGERWNYLLDDEAGIAYLRLTGFNPDSAVELKRALAAARSQGMRGLILDLRYNPGGLLDVAVEIVSLFVEDGEVVSTKGRAEPPQELDVTGEVRYADLPLIVLVNDSSASASEIFAGALQDHGRGVVLGERTYGKGSVQRVMMLERNLFQRNAPLARLKLTTALYYLPNGRTPHRDNTDDEDYGVAPDWEVDLTPKEFVRVIDRERSAFIIHNEERGHEPADEEAIAKRLEELKAEADSAHGGESDGEPLLSADDIQKLRSDPHEAPDIDPQLEVALLQMRVKLLADLPWPKLAKNTTHTQPQP